LNPITREYSKLFIVLIVMCYFTVMDIVPDLIEIGVDIFNPQFSGMDLPRLTEMTGGRMCILADIDRQYILPKGTVKEVKEYVKYIFDLFVRKKGGFIFRGWIIDKGTPLRNVEAMHEAYEEHKIPTNNNI